MKPFLVLCILLFNIVASDMKVPALEQHQQLLDSISKYAIHLGTGEDKLYIFLDPLCPKSQFYLSLITQEPDHYKNQSLYIFLYELKRYNSEELIFYIYQSKDPYQALLDVMVRHKEIDLFDLEFSEETDRQVEEIAKVAKILNIQRRPYLLLFEKGSPYCIVSNGTAPCMEEYDLHHP